VRLVVHPLIFSSNICKNLSITAKYERLRVRRLHTFSCLSPTPGEQAMASILSDEHIDSEKLSCTGKRTTSSP
jgi:hypothetical protein